MPDIPTALFQIEVYKYIQPFQSQGRKTQDLQAKTLHKSLSIQAISTLEHTRSFPSVDS